jgi:hypothetical protein
MLLLLLLLLLSSLLLLLLSLLFKTRAAPAAHLWVHYPIASIAANVGRHLARACLLQTLYDSLQQ